MPDLATEFAEIDGSDSLSDSDKEKQKNELQNKMNAQGEKIHSISQLLKAYCLYERDVDYVVTNNKVVIVCLLYTSPSPRDLSTSRMPSSA